MTPISEALRELLARDGMTRERLAGQARGIGDDGVRDREGAQPHHQPTGEGGANRSMGNSGKGRQPKPAPVRQEFFGVAKPGFAFPYVVHTNHAMSGMPMRQTTHSPRAIASRGVVSLMVITGGKA